MRPAERSASIDAYRGLVMLILLPNLDGGFSFYEVARRVPDSELWKALAAQFTHTQWSGWTVWDLVMPSFVFLVGVSMPLSAAARRARGESGSRILLHVVARSIALLCLSLVLRMPIRTVFDELWPMLLVALGLPIPRWTADRLGLTSPRGRAWLAAAWWIAILSATAVRIALKYEQISDDDLEGGVLTQLALASVFAFLLVGKPRAVQLGAAVGILVAYWVAFALYPLPDSRLDPASVGVMPGDEIFGGFFAHWNKNTNFASAFDVWLLNLLPRTNPFVYDNPGLATLSFVPTIATMVFGIMAGELVGGGLPRTVVRNRLLAAGVVAVAAGLLAAQWVCPLVKSIWTPSWAVFSAGCTALVLGALYQLLEVRNRARWARPLAVLGGNAILLYALSYYYRWWFLGHFKRIVGTGLFVEPYAPLVESMVFLAMLWGIAYVLHELDISIKI
jgi:heparan-alpha-glucosaminide N-acetyltransferase